MVIRDNLGTPDGAKKADRELIAAGAVAIIGHAISSQTFAGLSVTEPAQVVMFSPTTSSANLSSKDDYFLRVIHTLADRARGLAHHVYQQRGVQRLAVIYDTHNAAYVQSFKNIFIDKYRSLGGTVAGETGFSSKERTNFDPLLAKLRASNGNGLLIIASDTDTALIAQRARLIGWQVPLYTSAWAQTETLIKNGSQAVEGIEFEQTLPLNSQSPAFVKFKKQYQERFGRSPSFSAILGYESVLVLADALQRCDVKREGLRQALLDTRNFQGLVDKFFIDKYDDVVRPFYLGAIRDGNYVDIERFVPSMIK